MVSAGRGNGRGPCPAGAPSPGSAFRPDGAHRFSPAAPAIVALTSCKRCRTLIGSSASPVRESRTSGARGPSPLDSPEVPIVWRIDWPPLLARDAASFVAVDTPTAIIAWPGAGSRILGMGWLRYHPFFLAAHAFYRLMSWPAARSGSRAMDR